MNRAIRRLQDLGREPFDVNKIAEDINMGDPAPRLPLLETREHTHGSFEANAIISQSLKSAYRSVPGWARLTEVEREAMDMIAVKFSRILSGKSMEKQHWEDVVGYAKLVEEKCLG